MELLQLKYCDAAESENFSKTAGSSHNRITNQICENAGFSPKIVNTNIEK